MKHLLTTKIMTLVAMLSMILPSDMEAADSFVVFEPAADTWQLESFTIGYSEAEHSCVRLAAANLATDFEKVTGATASIIPHSSFLIPHWQ